MLNIVFMGTPDFAKDSLEVLYKNNYNILGVVTTPDKPQGRGMKLVPCKVKEFAMQNNLRIYEPETIKDNKQFIEELKKLKPDVICVVAYGKILPKEILDIPKSGCINIHPSMLPKYRGPAPIQWAIMNGDKSTGVTAMYVNEKMDSGDIILQKEVTIKENETTGELWDRLSKIGAKLLIETLEKIEKNIAPKIKQSENFTLAPMLNKEMAKIDWEKGNALQLNNLIRGLNPIMGAYTYLNGKKIKIWKASVVSIKEFVQKYKEFGEYMYRFSNMENGTIIYVDKKEGIYVKTKEGILLILEIQGENSKKMKATDFLRGNEVKVVDIFQ